MLFYHIQKLDSNKLKIPYALRAQLNLYDETNEYLTIQRNIETANYCELIISPISFEIRKDLWLLKAEFKDKIGLINEISYFFTSQNIDILSFKAVTIDNHNRLSIEILFDSQFYVSAFDKNADFRNKNFTFTLTALKSKFVATFIESIDFLPNTSKPRVLLTKNHSLNLSVNNSLNNREISNIKDSIITIPQVLFSQIKQNLLESNPYLSYTDLDKIVATIVSEPENNFFRVYLFVENTGIIHFRVKTRNKIGTIASITKIIRDNNLNVIHLNTRSIGNSHFGLSDIVIKSEVNPKSKERDKPIREFIEDIFENSHLKEEFNWSIDFPRFLKEIDKPFYG